MKQPDDDVFGSKRSAAAYKAMGAFVPKSRRGRVAVIRTFSVMHSAVYRLSGGRVGGRAAGQKVVLLTTTGRHSGKRRTRPILGTPHGDNLYVTISATEPGAVPGWYRNLESHPRVDVTVDGIERAAIAEILAEPDRTDAWDLMKSKNVPHTKVEPPNPMPVVRLRLLGPADGGA